uniref:Uncharacterized protein n=1 Tax=Caenorhabditis japonica TaxID=281687 RepID=A0A8R1INS1_CAEJA
MTIQRDMKIEDFLLLFHPLIITTCWHSRLLPAVYDPTKVINRPRKILSQSPPSRSLPVIRIDLVWREEKTTMTIYPKFGGMNH